AVVVIWVAFFLVSCLCAAAVVRAAEALDRDEDCGLGRALSLGAAGFFAVLRLRLLAFVLGLAVLAVAAIVAGLVFLSVVVHAYVAVVLLVLLAIQLALPLFLLTVVYPTFLRLWLRAVALDGIGAWAGLGDTVHLIRRQPGPVVVLWAIE